MKIFIKGGPWKNVEDEILKSAVMKYGKNQWDRIASLLSRKSAKQCKARWYEWLDPSIKKTPWTREEEEKLLHLVKIMPTQWRTIAPIVGRTAFQCMEHFEFLLDKYQERDEDYDPEDDPRLLKAGEIDYNAEHKPALPDPVDMDEDEKEMLSEARARMANTMGKKAKRRAREKQLEDQRRLSLLKKKRELKAAGIYVIEENITTKKKLKNQFRKIDFLKEVPYQKRAPAGFYDTLKEKVDSAPLPIERSLNLIEGNIRDKGEEEKRKEDKKKMEKQKTRDLPEVIQKIKQINNPDLIEKRGKIELPSPQITDEDLKTLSKIGFNIEETDNQVTNKLLSNYTTTPQRITPFQQRNIRTPLMEDNLIQETKDIMSLRNAQTPLTGEMLPKVSFRKKKKKVGGGGIVQTPNPFKNQQNKRLTTPRNTPFRDELSINEPNSLFIESNRKLERKRQQLKREKLRSHFLTIPKPLQNKYYFKINVPKEQNEVDEKIVQDKSDIIQKKKEQEYLKQERIFNMRSNPVKKSLPRPVKINPEFYKDYISPEKRNEYEQKAKLLICEEMKNMVDLDMKFYPVHSSLKKNQLRKIELEFEESDLIRANEIIEKEMEHFVDKIPSQQQFSLLWKNIVQNLVGNNVILDDMNEKEKMKLLEENYKYFQEKFFMCKKKVEKLENKVNILTKGYLQVAGKVQHHCFKVRNEIRENEIKLKSFTVLNKMEEQTIPRRIRSLNETIERKMEENKNYQNEFIDTNKSVDKMEIDQNEFDTNKSVDKMEIDQ